jgi:1-deoxy-D-xylulose-5-phosphate synthase
MQFMSDDGLLDGGVKVRSLVLPDFFIDHDSPAKMYESAGLDAQHIVRKALETLGVDEDEMPVIEQPKTA